METGGRTPETEGVLLVDKPAGFTSHDVVAIVRRATHAQRVGHTGTLDPFATGLLVLLVGRGTRLIPYVDGEPKVYDATIRLGAETDTDDWTGDIIRTAGTPGDEVVAEAIASLTGAIQQVPPAYSAKLVAGTRAYAAARRGESLVLAPTPVIVHEWKLTGRNGADLSATITCSGGTYIRALARDLGRLSRSAAHLAALRRTHTGPFSLREAVSLDDVRAGEFVVRPLRVAIPSLPVYRLDPTEFARVRHGNSIAARSDLALPDGARTALVDDEEILIAVAERAGNDLRPKLVLRGD
jgi:tRNA pseudouridine55 synthase